MIETLLLSWGEGPVLALAGLAVGVIFGVAAERSQFCLRASTVEVAEGHAGPRFSIWLIAFFAALTLTQGLIAAGALDVSGARQLAATGSLSGAIIGGVMFGVGMVLARGCASRLLVLSATGNLRALITGLVVTLVAQAAYNGALAPLREALVGLWTIPGNGSRNMAGLLGFGAPAAAFIGIMALSVAIAFARRHAMSWARIIGAAVVGAAVTLGWLATYVIAQNSFEIIPISSVTFTGPATDTLMALVAERSVSLSFGIGLVPGVFLGAGASSILAGAFKLQRFGPDSPMERYLLGAVLMGFGAMAAGGCAVGAGVSGGAILSLTAWVAVAAMWVGAMVTVWITKWMGARGNQPATS
ncbi:YeeE/YedE family protein [Rhodobacteraceae bacterium XHP0102]|nr:YeeE/YedE family protein [Rhodobacteraceae bacterium XHP0102]